MRRSRLARSKPFTTRVARRVQQERRDGDFRSVVDVSAQEPEIKGVRFEGKDPSINPGKDLQRRIADVGTDVNDLQGRIRALGQVRGNLDEVLSVRRGDR